VPHAPILAEGVIVAYNRAGGLGSVSREGSITWIPFGRSAVDDAERDEIRAGRRCRFALAEGRSSTGGVKVAKLVVT